jgi:hypothetical protein
MGHVQDLVRYVGELAKNWCERRPSGKWKRWEIVKKKREGGRFSGSVRRENGGRTAGERREEAGDAAFMPGVFKSFPGS